MHLRRSLAVGGTLATLSISPAMLSISPAGAVVAAPAPRVTVRVEGMTRTLLPTTVTQTHAGWITRFGAPSGKCPATSAAGALDSSTKHDWSGKWEASFNDYEVMSILGESHTFSSHHYWSLWIDNAYSNAGFCGSKLRSGEHLLFAVEPDTSYWYPLGVRAPRRARVGHPVTVKVVWFNVNGVAKPLLGAHVDGRVTNSHGIVRVVPTKKGTLVLRATHAGYIRDQVLVRVTS
jgi:hypothetical protein